MRKKIVLFFTTLLLLTIIFLLFVLVINKDSGKGALQVTSIPQARVFVNGELKGRTPLCLCELKNLLGAGEYAVKVVPSPDFKPYEQKINIYSGVLSVVDRTFDKNSSSSQGSVITLAPIDNKSEAELLILSFPSKASVLLDSNQVGITPLLLKNTTLSDHEVKIIKEGYKEKVLKVRTVSGRRLEATVYLGIRPEISGEKKASPSASVVHVTILSTPTGFLRVRQDASLESAQLTTVEPGENFELLDEKDGWYKIKLKDGRLGWITSDYATKDQ